MGTYHTHRSVDGKVTHITSNDGTQVTPIRDVDGVIVGYDVKEPLKSSDSTVGGYSPALDKAASNLIGSVFKKIIKFNIISGIVVFCIALVVCLVLLILGVDIS